MDLTTNRSARRETCRLYRALQVYELVYGTEVAPPSPDVAAPHRAGPNAEQGGQGGRRCGLPSIRDRSPLPRCARGAADEARAAVVAVPAEVMGQGDFLYASILALARACVVIASGKSSLGRLLHTVAEWQPSDHCPGGKRRLVDMDGVLTSKGQEDGRYYCQLAVSAHRVRLC